MSDDELLDIIADGKAKPAAPGKESAAEYLERMVEKEQAWKPQMGICVKCDRKRLLVNPSFCEQCQSDLNDLPD